MSQLTELLKQKLLTIAVAESCTGGNLSVLLTEESGSSDYFDRGFITYSDQAKIELLGVKRSTLDAYGAVSEQTALEMVEGVIQNSNANIGVSITGIAGPTGGTKNKPVGTVCFGFCILGECTTIRKYFDGERQQVMQKSVGFVVDTLKGLL
ncbi:Nicotinamide-nucleotide amidase (EC 3.5.1.42) [uncultured Gammaproteobacteria bacterium]|jgi:nicotinamide-nucleotide amidase|uniref:CinA family protein n=1 Tax=thiotrophic endosymbiont of Bathymodiolus puteoserpentis (Logatchev) TaxID=343240 RepID=UPI0010B5352B|nr:CinA family protein [thiotrophic endosymbiont of Bathymodiolus puteoserpentis (Logatchev)]CAC9495103.1 Nicotinamide-nucleotide amidase (EC 3.5.1.42) [uncultured Gammaproteobacteria bacterium]CAC9646313.1 Nicotinamide-nucleotide amidase (EC 3.5.1.42) [uncultured Gammaproteobacteria bacterium]CAC9653026.1 Nicotinamide-nucleotide amidase (EC 3.5.1.42) [uncultured Gammaproteobacteria bacterium]CAC9653045.1 Nicotinamide-nucleotide amidase (EC 3.5.1.42) [uncultured Gammaproteobacteria bacterium]C